MVEAIECRHRRGPPRGARRRAAAGLLPRGDRRRGRGATTSRTSPRTCRQAAPAQPARLRPGCRMGDPPPAGSTPSGSRSRRRRSSAPASPTGSRRRCRPCCGPTRCSTGCGRAGLPLPAPAASTGDLGAELLALVGRARAEGVDPEQALRAAVAGARGRSPTGCGGPGGLRQDGRVQGPVRAWPRCLVASAGVAVVAEGCQQARDEELVRPTVTVTAERAGARAPRLPVGHGPVAPGAPGSADGSVLVVDGTPRCDLAPLAVRPGRACGAGSTSATAPRCGSPTSPGPGPRRSPTCATSRSPPTVVGSPSPTSSTARRTTGPRPRCRHLRRHHGRPVHQPGRGGGTARARGCCTAQATAHG